MRQNAHLYTDNQALNNWIESHFNFIYHSALIQIFIWGKKLRFNICTEKKREKQR